MREDKEVDMKPVINLLGHREGRFARWVFERMEIFLEKLGIFLRSWEYF